MFELNNISNCYMT